MTAQRALLISIFFRAVSYVLYIYLVVRVYVVMITTLRVVAVVGR